jgi:hypothetical protein
VKRMMNDKCAYCKEPATDKDVVGLPACHDHLHYADDYYKRCTGRDPDEDSFLYCPEHCDMWQENCVRCEACSQHHYGVSVKESAPQRTITVIWGD